MDRIRETGRLRVGWSNVIPFSYFNTANELAATISLLLMPWRAI
jgi:hypothetical protein